MSAEISSFSSGLSRAPQGVLMGGAIAGTLDILAAFINMARFDVSPTRVLQAIASGALGASAYRGGFWTALLGLCFHFLIAFTAAAVYYAMSLRYDVLIRRAALCGSLYGVAIYLFMNFVVLPLSAIAYKQTFPLS